MRSIRIAEWILGLSMTRERAEAVAGDLREAERGSFWFWRTVVATMIASAWSDFLSESVADSAHCVRHRIREFYGGGHASDME